MGTQGELLAAAANRNAVSAALSQGVSLKSALLYIATMGLPKNARSVIATTMDNWRSDFGWSEASGNAYERNILINRPTGTIRPKGGLRQRDFEEENIIDTASYSYYTIEQTYGINEDDLRLNRDNKTRIVNIRSEKRKQAEAGIHAALVQVPHYATETGHNAGLSIMSPTNVAASTTLGGIAMDATDNYSNSYWAPGNYDYGTKTIATDFFVIHQGAISAVERSASAGGLGRVGPDFAYMHPDAWAKVMEFYNDILSMPISSGKVPQNLNLLENGFRNIFVDGVVLFPDDQFGGSTGYIDADNDEEIMYGNSKSMRIVTCNAKSEGFIRALPVVKDNAIVSGELGVFKVDPFAFVIDDAKHFGLAYT